MVEVRFACIDVVEGVKCTLDGVVKYSNAAGLASFFDVAQGEHTYSVEKAGMYVVSGEDSSGKSLGASGTTMIENPWVPGTPWPEDEPWMLVFNFEEGEPPKGLDMLGKIGAALGAAGFIGILLTSAWKRKAKST